MIEVISTRQRTRLLQNWVNGMQVAGVAPTTIQKDAVRALLRALDGIGLSKFKGLWPFVGGTAAAHALDLMGRYPITWAGGLTHDANGVTGNGSTGWGDTGLDPAAAGVGHGDLHLSVYSSANATSGHQLSTAIGSPTRITALAVSRTDVSTHFLQSQAAYPFSSVADGSNVYGHFVGVRRDTSNHHLYRNGTEIINAVKSSNGVVSGRTVGILAQNSSSVIEFSNGRLGLASYGLALSVGEVSAFSTAVLAFQSALFREV